MTAKSALVKELLLGKVINVKTCFMTIGLTNCSREISRMIEKPFGVIVSRTERRGKSKYGQPVVWFDFRLNKSDHNMPGIQKMIEYLQSQESENPKTEKELRTEKSINQIKMFQ